LRVTGCLYFVANLKPFNKFENRANKCIFLGYLLGYKGYKLYNLATKQFFHIRGILFYENVFPFKQAQVFIGISLQGSNPVSLPSCTPFFITPNPISSVLPENF